MSDASETEISSSSVSLTGAGPKSRAAYQREWRKKNLDKSKAYQREWREKNAERLNARDREQRKKNPEKALARLRKWYKKNPEKAASNSREWHKKNPEKIATRLRKSRLKSKFGIGVEYYEALLRSQKEGCAICGKQGSNKRALAVDHCHVTGKIRGLLCGRCNMGIGLLGDTAQQLKAAYEYVVGDTSWRLKLADEYIAKWTGLDG
jgi:hypothetical protein